MGKKWLILTSLAMLLPGCPVAGPPAGGAVSQEERNRLLQVQVNASSERIAELQARCDKLDIEIRRLSSLNHQLEEQLKAVGDAPRQRDMYKRQVRDLTAEVERLRTRLQLSGIPTRPAAEPVQPDASTRASATASPAPSATQPVQETP